MVKKNIKSIFPKATTLMIQKKSIASITINGHMAGGYQASCHVGIQMDKKSIGA